MYPSRGPGRDVACGRTRKDSRRDPRPGAAVRSRGFRSLGSAEARDELRDEVRELEGKREVLEPVVVPRFLERPRVEDERPPQPGQERPRQGREVEGRIDDGRRRLEVDERAGEQHQAARKHDPVTGAEGEQAKE